MSCTVLCRFFMQHSLFFIRLSYKCRFSLGFTLRETPSFERRKIFYWGELTSQPITICIQIQSSPLFHLTEEKRQYFIFIICFIAIWFALSNHRLFDWFVLVSINSFPTRSMKLIYFLASLYRFNVELNYLWRTS